MVAERTALRPSAPSRQTHARRPMARRSDERSASLAQELAEAEGREEEEAVRRLQAPPAPKREPRPERGGSTPKRWAHNLLMGLIFYEHNITYT